MGDYAEYAREFLAVMKQDSKSGILNQFNVAQHGELMILAHLYSAQPTQQPPNEISKATGTSPARVSAILNSLEKKGYIQRDNNLNDRRKVLVSITETGKKKALLEKDRALKRLNSIFLAMGERNVKELIGSVRLFISTGTAILTQEQGGSK